MPNLFVENRKILDAKSTQETNALCSVNSMGLANLHTHASLPHCTHVHAFACGLRPLLCGYVQISWRQRSISCAQINQNTVDKRGLAPWPYIFSWRCSSFARNTSDSRLSVRTFRLWMQSTSQPLRLLSELSALFICLAIFETNCDTTYDMCRSVKSPWVSSSSFATNFGSKQCDVDYSCFAITLHFFEDHQPTNSTWITVQWIKLHHVIYWQIVSNISNNFGSLEGDQRQFCCIADRFIFIAMCICCCCWILAHTWHRLLVI